MAFGKLTRVPNADQKFGSSDHYYQVMVKSDEQLETLLLTEHEMDKIRERVTKNPEDTVMIPTWWDKLSSFIADLF
jgi:hypothetical protein